MGGAIVDAEAVVASTDSAFEDAEVFEGPLADAEVETLRFRGAGRARGLKELRRAAFIIGTEVLGVCVLRLMGGVDRVRIEAGRLNSVAVVAEISCSTFNVPFLCERCFGMVGGPFSICSAMLMGL